MTGKQHEAHAALQRVQEFLYTQLKAQERHSATLSALKDALDSKQPGDEWLEVAEETLTRGAAFANQQVTAFEAMQAEHQQYVASVREIADEQALKGQ
jgi:hypothetical protein